MSSIKGTASDWKTVRQEIKRNVYKKATVNDFIWELTGQLKHNLAASKRFLKRKRPFPYQKNYVSAASSVLVVYCHFPFDD